PGSRSAGQGQIWEQVSEAAAAQDRIRPHQQGIAAVEGANRLPGTQKSGSAGESGGMTSLFVCSPLLKRKSHFSTSAGQGQAAEPGGSTARTRNHRPRLTEGTA